MSELKPVFDDEIDLREIVRTLWKTRRVILSVTLLIAVAAFIVNFWILPKQYQATAYVFIGQPVVEFSKSDTDSGLTISATLPDLTAVVELSTAPGLLESVLKDTAVAAAMGDDEINLSDMSENMIAVSDLGKDQLSLQVTDTDPQRAALIANTWAQKVSETVNTTYGLDAVARALDSQVFQSLQNYQQAQMALEEALSKSQTDALSAQLDSKNSDQASVLGSIIRTQRVLDDLQFFEQGLSDLSGDTPLSLGDGLALTTLRQRSLTVASESFTVQIDSASFAGFTVSKALEASAQMRTGLEAQLTRLQSDQSRLEQEIPQLQRELSNANARMEIFSTKRNQTLGIYNTLLSQQQLVVTVLAQSSKVASLSVPAVPPEKKSSPKVMLNTALAGMLGGILSIFGVLVMGWWKGNDTSVP
jgi:uncharacterized protein involved in exopolysaccharide biosynthesis